MGRMADKIAAALAAEVAGRTGWDEPPGLYFLYLRGGEPRLRKVPVPDAIWAAGRPPVVLDRMSRVLGDLSGTLRPPAPEGLHGAAFYCEVWTADGGPPGTAQRSSVVEDSHAHTLHLRADRVEARSMWAVDRGGSTYGAVLRRDLDAEPVTQVSHTGPGKRISGNIPRSLERIVTAMLEVTMPR